MFVLGFLLLKVFSRYVLLGFIGFIKTKKSSFSKLGLGRLFLTELFFKFSKSDSWFIRNFFLTI